MVQGIGSNEARAAELGSEGAQLSCARSLANDIHARPAWIIKLAQPQCREPPHYRAFPWTLLPSLSSPLQSVLLLPPRHVPVPGVLCDWAFVSLTWISVVARRGRFNCHS